MLTKHEAKNQPGLYFWAEPNEIDGGATFCVISQADGYPATEAHDDWFRHLKDADEIARQLAETNPGLSG